MTGGLTGAVGVSGCLRLTESSGDDSTPNTEASTPTSEDTSVVESPTATPEETSSTESPTPTPTPGESSAEYTVVQGSVSSEVGVSLEGHQVEIYNVSNREFYKLSIDDGGFVQTVDLDSSLDLTFFYERDRDATDVENVPLLYSLAEELSVSGTEQEIGPFTIPRAYRTEIRIVDSDGNPVEDFPIEFRCPNGSGTGVRDFTTDADGYGKIVGASQTGFYFAGDITVEGGEDDGGRDLREITVTQESEYSVTVIRDRYDL